MGYNEYRFRPVNDANPFKVGKHPHIFVNLRFLGIMDFGHFKSCWYLQLFVLDNSYLVE